MWLSSLEIGAAQRRSPPSQKSRHNRSCVWTEAQAGMIFMVSGIVPEPRADNSVSAF